MTPSPAQEILPRQLVASGHLPLQIRLLSGRRILRVLLRPLGLVLAFATTAATGLERPLDSPLALGGLVLFVLTVHALASLLLVLHGARADGLLVGPPLPDAPTLPRPLLAPEGHAMKSPQTLRPVAFEILLGRITEIAPSVPERRVRVVVSSVTNPRIRLTFRGEDVRATLGMKVGQTLSLPREILLRALA